MNIKSEGQRLSHGTAFQLLSSLISTFIAVTDGMSMGWTAPMIPYLTSEKSYIKMSIEQAEWIETFLMIGVIFALPVTIYVVDKIGRKKTLLFCCFLLVIAWVAIPLARRVECIYVARFFQGFGLNMAFVTVPMYIAEISHKNHRGLMASIVFIMIMAGILLDYAIIPFVPHYIPPIIAVVLLTTQLVAFSFLPESPYYLVKTNQHKEAMASLQRFRGNSKIENEFSEILLSVENDNKETAAGLKVKSLFQVKNYRKSLIIVFFLNVSQTFSCNEIILMNIHEILNSSGTIYLSSTNAAIIFASLMMVSAVISSIMIDKFGRKVLLITSTVLTGISLLTLAVFFNFKQLGYNMDRISWIPTISVMFFAVVFKIGVGMVPIVITTEIFASNIRALGMTLADGFSDSMSIVSLQFFFYMQNTFGMYVAFYLFSFWSLITLCFTIFFVPETKGKSMQEIQSILMGDNISIETKLHSNNDI